MRDKILREWNIVEPVVSVMGYELTALERLKQSGRDLLRVYIDQPQGITLDDCVRVSHQLSGVLDVEDVFKQRYELEVSSPGLDRLLFKEQDFNRFAGQQVNIKLTVPNNGRRNFKGFLRGMREGQVVVEIEGGEYALPYLQIERARLVPE